MAAENLTPNLTPGAIARASFGTSFRGYDQQEVRDYLSQVAELLREAREREEKLEAALEAAREEAEAAREIDEDRLTTYLGEETARVLTTAREASIAIRARSEEEANRMLKEAEEEATRLRDEAERESTRLRDDAERESTSMREEAEQLLESQTAEAEAVANELREAANAEATAKRAEADRILVEAEQETERIRNEADAGAHEIRLEAAREADRTRAEAADRAAEEIEAAKQRGRDLVAEARLARERVLADLTRKRKAARVQLEVLRAGRDRLLDAYGAVREALDDSTQQLEGSLTEAKAAADIAAHRAEEEAEPTVEQLEAQIAAGHVTGIPLYEGDEVRAPAERLEAEAAAVEVTDDIDDELHLGDVIDEESESALGPESELAEAVVSDDEEAFALTESDESELPDERSEVFEDTTPPSRPDVDAIFARLRRSEELDTAPPDVDTDAGRDYDEGSPYEDSSIDEPPSLTVSTRDEALLERRDAATDEIEAQLARRLKRLLSDEQNEMLDRLRRRSDKTAESILPPGDEQEARYTQKTIPELEAAALAGAHFFTTEGVNGSGPSTSVTDLAAELASVIVGQLRQRVTSTFRDAEDDEDALAAGIRACYREWKTQRIGDTARHYVLAAFSRGLFDAHSGGTCFRWVIDDGGTPCPDAEDNALAGILPKGEPFPTGHPYPPAHPGCRCLIVPDS